MGCDFDLQIQALYCNVWITIYCLGTKTRCRGWPLCNTAWKAYRQNGCAGDYGIEYPLLPSKFVPEEVILSLDKQAEVLDFLAGNTTSRKKQRVEENDDEEKKEEDDKQEEEEE